MTLMTAFGAIVDRGRSHAEVFDLLGVPDWEAHADEVERRIGGFQSRDLYPDALPAIAALHAPLPCRIDPTPPANAQRPGHIKV